MGTRRLRGLVAAITCALATAFVLTLLPAQALAATVTIPFDASGVPTSSGGDGWTYDATNGLVLTDGWFAVNGTCTVNVTVGYSAKLVDGTFSGRVTLDGGVILGGNYTGLVTGYGTTYGGVFSGQFFATRNEKIMGGTFLTTLESSPVGASAYRIELQSPTYWGVTNTLTNLTTDNPATTVDARLAYSETLKESAGFALPPTISVTMNGHVATMGSDYTWDPITGKLVVPSVAVVDSVSEKNGPISVTAQGVTPSCILTITYQGTNTGASFVAPANVSKAVAEGAKYSVASPDVVGYVPSPATVSGTVGTEDVSTTVTYSPISYKVAFDANAQDATGTMANQDMTYDHSANLSQNAFSRPGYVFSHWSLTPDDTGRPYADGAAAMNLTTTAGETVTLYAQWIPVIEPTVNALTLTFKGSSTAGVPQPLVSVSGALGTMHWRLGTTGTWSTSIPTAIYPGTYVVYWYMDGSDDGSPKVASVPDEGALQPSATSSFAPVGSAAEPRSVTTTIAAAPTSITPGTITLTTTPSTKGSTTITLSEGLVNAKVTVSDPSKIEASLVDGVLTVTPRQGAGDVTGTYTVTISAASGTSNYAEPESVTVTVVVTADPTPATPTPATPTPATPTPAAPTPATSTAATPTPATPTEAPAPAALPATGDASSPAVPAAFAFLGLGAIAEAVASRRRA